MTKTVPHLGPAEAAARLGVSPKALRLYEERGLIAPARTAAGWRAYGPEAMRRAGEVVALRDLGLSLDAVARVLDGDAETLDDALADHAARLDAEMQKLSAARDRVGRLRAGIAAGRRPRPGEIAELAQAGPAPIIAFDLPWPWDGERFALHPLRALTHVVGPLGSGKTRLLKRIAEAAPNAVFLGLDRLAEDGAAARATLDSDPALAARVEAARSWLAGDGAADTPSLVALLAGLEANWPSLVVVDMLEQGLDHATQQALIAWLRRRGPDAPRVVFTTRSTAILDLDSAGPGETILFCPANHGPPAAVTPCRGAPGYEAVASCLADPAVRARTEGVIAIRPGHAGTGAVGGAQRG